MDCSSPGSSVQGIVQARILEWVVIPFSSGIFLTQGLNPGLLHCRKILYCLSHQGHTKGQIQQLILHLIYLFKNIYLFETIESWLRHVGFLLQCSGFSLVVLLGLSSCGMWVSCSVVCGISVPHPGIKPIPSALEG